VSEAFPFAKRKPGEIARQRDSPGDGEYRPPGCRPKIRQMGSNGLQVVLDELGAAAAQPVPQPTPSQGEPFEPATPAVNGDNAVIGSTDVGKDMIKGVIVIVTNRATAKAADTPGN
jgi:hypothetical protein